MLVLSGGLRRVSIILKASTLQVSPVFDERFHLALFNIPDHELATQGSRNKLILDAWMELALDNF